MSSRRALIVLLALSGLALALSLEPARIRLDTLRADWLQARLRGYQTESELAGRRQWYSLLAAYVEAQPRRQPAHDSPRREELGNEWATLNRIIEGSSTFRRLADAWNKLDGPSISGPDAPGNSDRAERLERLEQTRLALLEAAVRKESQAGRDLFRVGPDLTLEAIPASGFWPIDSSLLRLALAVGLLLAAGGVLCWSLVHRWIRRHYRALDRSGRNVVLLAVVLILVGWLLVEGCLAGWLWGAGRTLVHLPEPQRANLRLAVILRSEVARLNRGSREQLREIERLKEQTRELAQQALSNLESVKRVQTAALERLEQREVERGRQVALQEFGKKALESLREAETTFHSAAPPATRPLPLLPAVILAVGMALPLVVAIGRWGRPRFDVALLGVPDSGTTRLADEKDPESWTFTEPGSLPERTRIHLVNLGGDDSRSQASPFRPAGVILFLDPTQAAAEQRDQLVAWHTDLCRRFGLRPGRSVGRPVAVCLANLDRLASDTLFGSASVAWLDRLRETETLPTWIDRARARSRLVEEVLCLLLPGWPDPQQTLEEFFGQGNILFVPLVEPARTLARNDALIDPVKWLLYCRGYRVESADTSAGEPQS